MTERQVTLNDGYRCDYSLRSHDTEHLKREILHCGDFDTRA